MMLGGRRNKHELGSDGGGDGGGGCRDDSGGGVVEMGIVGVKLLGRN